MNVESRRVLTRSSLLLGVLHGRSQLTNHFPYRLLLLATLIAGTRSATLNVHLDIGKTASVTPRVPFGRICVVL